ncbi:MAG: hypothetical protein CL678_16495 [Bdellovibrionaceae bacterium]|nr:hypothetical protein [Pseudobdellovibrionaceae bacterium]
MIQTLFWHPVWQSCDAAATTDAGGNAETSGLSSPQQTTTESFDRIAQAKLPPTSMESTDPSDAGGSFTVVSFKYDSP